MVGNADGHAVAQSSARAAAVRPPRPATRHTPPPRPTSAATPDRGRARDGPLQTCVGDDYDWGRRRESGGGDREWATRTCVTDGASVSENARVRVRRVLSGTIDRPARRATTPHHRRRGRSGATAHDSPRLASILPGVPWARCGAPRRRRCARTPRTAIQCCQRGLWRR